MRRKRRGKRIPRLFGRDRQAIQRQRGRCRFLPAFRPGGRCARRGILEARLLGEIRIDLALGDFDLLRHFALAQALRRDFVADFIAEGREGDAVGEKPLTELFNREIILPRNLLDRGVHHLVVHADARLTGALQNRAFGNEALEDLRAQKLHRRQLNILAAQVDRHRMHALLKLVLGDDVVVDDGDDAVEFARFEGSRRLSGFSRGCGRSRRSRINGTARRRAVHDARSRSKAGGKSKRRGNGNRGKKLGIIHRSRKDRSRPGADLSSDSRGCCGAVLKAD